MQFSRSDWTGGWKVLNVDFANAKIAGIDAETSLTTHPNGLWIEGSTITGITGVTVPASGADTTDYTPGFDVFCGTAIMVSRVDNVTIKNVTVGTSDMPLYLLANNTFTVDGLVSDHTYYEGAWLSVRLATTNYEIGAHTNEVESNGTFTNSHISYAGYSPGMYWGTAGLQINGGSNIAISSTEIDHTGGTGSTPDRVGIDWEGYGSSNVTANLVNVHDNQGAGVLIFHSAGGTGTSNTGTSITNSTFANNGAGLSTVGFMRLVNNESNNVVVTGNTFTRTTAGACPSGQCLNNVSDTAGGAQGNQDTFPARFTASGNTITN